MKKFVKVFSLLIVLTVLFVSCQKPPVTEPTKEKVAVEFRMDTKNMVHQPAMDLLVSWYTNSNVANSDYTYTLLLTKPGNIEKKFADIKGINNYRIPGIEFVNQGTYKLKITGVENKTKTPFESAEIIITVPSDVDIDVNVEGVKKTSSAAAPEIRFENNLGYPGMHFSKYTYATYIPMFTEVSGYITSPANLKIASAKYEVIKLIGGRNEFGRGEVSSQVLHSVPVTLVGGTKYIFDWTDKFMALEPGKYELRVSATDVKGNTNYKSLVFYMHSIELDAAKRVSTYKPTGDVVIPVDGLTGDVEMKLFNADFTPCATQATVAADKKSFTIPRLPEGGYNLLISKANGVYESMIYSFFVSSGVAKSGVSDLDFMKQEFNRDSAYNDIGFTADGFMKFTIENKAIDLTKINKYKSAMFRLVPHTFAARYYAIEEMAFARSLSIGGSTQISVLKFGADTQRVKVELMGKTEANTCSAMAGTYFTVMNNTDEAVYLKSTASDVPVTTGKKVTLDIDLRNVNDFGALSTKLVINELNINKDAIQIETPKVSADKKEFAKTIVSQGLIGGKKVTEITLLKSLVNDPKQTKTGFKGNGNILSVTFEVPADTKPGTYKANLVGTIVKDYKNTSKSEVRDDTEVYINVQ